MAKPKDKHPWFKFFPANWRGNTKLRLCSIGARGLWMEMLCIMHDAEPYGHLLNNGVAVSNKQLAQLAGIALTEVQKFMCELELAGVYSRTDDKIIFSRKMVRDKAKTEKAQYDGLDGGNPYIRRGTVEKSDRVRPFKRSDAPQKTRRIFEKSNGKCHWCSVDLLYQPDGGPRGYHVDHLLPVCDGGTNDEENLVAACADCNHKRARISDPTGSPVVRVGYEPDHKHQKQKPNSNTKATAAAEAVELDEGQEKQALSLRVMLAAIRSGKKWSVPNLDQVDVWIAAGIAPNTISTACAPLLNRKEDMASLAYCDSAVRAAHEAAPHLTVVGNKKVFVIHGTQAWTCWQQVSPGGRGWPVRQRENDRGVLQDGWDFESEYPPGYDEATGERIASAENEDAA